MVTLRQQNLFIKAYYTLKSSLEKYTRFKVNNPAVCEDLVQETFLKTWKYMVRGGKIATMKAFLYHVLNGLIIDRYRKRKTVSLDTLVDNGFEPKEDEFDEVINALDSQRAIEMFAMLPRKYRRLMHMKYVKNLSLDEIAKATGQTKNTTAVQTSRGLQKLKEIYNRQIERLN